MVDSTKVPIISAFVILFQQLSLVVILLGFDNDGLVRSADQDSGDFKVKYKS